MKSAEKDLEYLKHIRCPYCMGSEVVDKVLKYKGCANDDYSMVFMNGEYRQWRRLPSAEDRGI